jgi:hypothetical protein
MDAANTIEERLDELEARLRALAAEKDHDIAQLRKHLDRLEQRLREAEAPEATPGTI